MAQSLKVQPSRSALLKIVPVSLQLVKVVALRDDSERLVPTSDDWVTVLSIARNLGSFVALRSAFSKVLSLICTLLTGLAPRNVPLMRRWEYSCSLSNNSELRSKDLRA